MPLSVGERLGPYEILAPIGAGGMGEVYKACDMRLDRSVAIKVCRQQFSERFEREARAIASLNHPHICTLHDVGPDYLVMEYIEGAPLEGPLPLGRVLQYGAQICDALDAAHQKGITHRDLKPANILVTRSGVKLLDFGLAKTAAPPIAPGDATRPMALTARHQIVGTLYYMSPEQLQAQEEGSEVDARSDIFSFGLVLYEMLTGKRAFDGASTASVIAAIMEHPAPSIADIAPAALDHVLQLCLQKDRAARWQSTRDIRAELEWIASTPATAAKTAPVKPSRPIRWIVATAVLAAVAAAASWTAWRATGAADSHPMVHLDLHTGGGSAFSPIISRDGSRVLFVSRDGKGTRLVVRRLDETALTEIAGSDGASLPFFAPDGRSVGFFANGQIKKLVLDGGAPVAIADAPLPGGAAWGEQGSIAAIRNLWTTSVLEIIPAVGGAPRAMMDRNPLENPSAPQFLPGNKLLFTAVQWTPAWAFSARLFVPGEKAPRLVLKDAMGARFLETGHLVFLRAGRLFAVPFDINRNEVTGEPIPMVDEVASNAEVAQFDVSPGGRLVYVRAYPLKWWPRASIPREN